MNSEPSANNNAKRDNKHECSDLRSTAAVCIIVLVHLISSSRTYITGRKKCLKQKHATGNMNEIK